MNLIPEVLESPAALGTVAAELIHQRLTQDRDRPFLLGCPGGRSLAPTYEALAAIVAERGTNLAGLTIVMMDDYVVPDERGRFSRVSAQVAYSCERFGRENILAPLDASAARGRRMGSDALWLPDPMDPSAYDEQIADRGGIDLFLLASGDSDGHIAFNPPGSGRESRTRVVELAPTTRHDNLSTFPAFGGDISQVPTHGVTVGIDSIASLPASVLMVCTGPGKGASVARITTASEYEPDWPATIVVECSDPHLLIDRAALASAESIADPTPAYHES